MLDTLRRHSNSWIFKGLFAVLIVFFVFWGISGSVLNNFGESQTAITVGKQEFSGRQVVEAFRRDAERLIAASGGKITIEQARRMGLLQNTVQQMVNRALLDQAAAGLQLTVTDDTLRGLIADNPAFQNELKRFDKRIYLQTLARAGLTEQGYLGEERGNILREELVTTVAGGIAAPAQLAEPLFTYQREQRVAQTITVPVDQMAAPPRPGDDVLRAAYEASKDSYMAPETRALTAVVVRTSDIAATIHPSEDDIEKSYQVRQGEFQTQEKRSILQAVFADQAKAQAVSDAVRQGKDFAAEAKAAGSALGDLGWQTKAGVPLPELANAAFALPANGVSAPVQSPLGWHVIKVAGIQPAASRSLADVRDKVIAGLVHDEALNRIFALSTKIEDSIGSGASVEEAAGSVEQKPLKIAAIDAQGNGPDGKPVAGVPLEPAFLQTVFDTASGSASEVKPLADDGGYFVVRVDAVTPAAVRPFAQVKDQVAAAWTAEQRAQAAHKTAEALATRLRNGDNVAAVAGSYKLDSTKPFGRSPAPNSALSPVLVGQMFKAQPGGVAVIDLPGAVLVARLDQILPADPKAQPAVFEAARRQLSQEVGNDVMTAFMATLQKDQGVRINSALIEQQFDK